MSRQKTQNSLYLNANYLISRAHEILILYVYPRKHRYYF